MVSGIAVTRQWISVLSDGTIILDWGDGKAVDLILGEIMEIDPGQFSHPIQDSELETLRQMGRVVDYDQAQVYLASMPDMPTGSKSIE